MASAASAQQFTLTSVGRNIREEKWETAGKNLTPDAPGWSVRKTVLHGGKQEGVDLIVLDNGKLQITICPTRGMGIMSVVLGDVRLGWNSPVKEVVHPRHINLQSRGGLGWLEGFNEWMVRCGLESAGHPGTDKFINNVGDEATMDLTLHGKIANIPASEVEVIIEKQPPHRIRIRGRVDERMFYGPKFELWTEISTEPLSNAFRVSDTLTNHGAADHEFEIIYHCNYGRPLLEDGAVFSAALAKVVPFNANAAKGIKTFDQCAGPTDGFIEQVYCLYPAADKDGKTLAMLRNRKGDRAVSVAFSVKELPHLTLWKNLAAEAEGYVTGIEPGTNFAYNRRIERAAGRVQKIAPNATRGFTLDFAIHGGEQQVKQVAERIAAIQSGRPVAVEQNPPKID